MKFPKVTWTQRNVEGHKLSQFLTTYNLQPGRFFVIPAVDGSRGWVTVVVSTVEEATV